MSDELMTRARKHFNHPDLIRLARELSRRGYMDMDGKVREAIEEVKSWRVNTHHYHRLYASSGGLDQNQYVLAGISTANGRESMGIQFWAADLRAAETIKDALKEDPRYQIEIQRASEWLSQAQRRWVANQFASR